VAEAAGAPDRDSAVAGQAEGQEDLEVERGRAGAAAPVRAEVYGKREKPRVEVEEPARAAEELEAQAAVAEEQAPVAEAARVKELAVVVDLDRAGLEVAGLEVVGLEVAGLEAVEDLDRAGLEVVGLEAVGQEAVGQEAAEDWAEDLAEVQVVLAEPELGPGRVGNRGSGAQLRRCCATP